MSLETPNAVETLKNTVKPEMTQEEISTLKLSLEKLTPEQQAEFKKYLLDATTNAKDALFDLKEDIPKDTITVSPTFANLMKENQELARMGARIEGNQIILPQGFEHQEKIKKLERVVYYIDFLSNPIDKTNETERTKNQDEKLKIYFELSNENTDWILDRRFLKMKYIASMYEDIRNEGGILVKKDGKYSLEKDGQPVNNHPYAKLLNPNFVNQNDLDFAVLFSIANTDNLIEQEGFVTQKGLIKRLLDKHGITSAESEGQEIQEAELLLIDKVDVVKQIDEKIKGKEKTNRGHYQELVFLKNYIEQEEYSNEIYNRKLFTDVNEYRNLYLAEKGLYDVLKANNGKNMTPENYGDMIANTAKEYQLPLGALGILLLLFKDTRKWGLGALGAAIGLPIVGGIASKVENAAKGNKSGSVFTDEQLGLLKLRDIKPFTEDLRSEETPVLQAITAKNEEWRKDPSYKSRSFHYPQTLTATYKAIKGIDATTLQDISSDNITSKSQEIFAKIGNDQQIEGLKEGTKITKDDVTKLLQLLSATKDATDDNLLDMVVEGKHILNTPYEYKAITNSPFDTQLNEILEKHYDTTSDSQEKRTKLADLIDTIVSENNTYLQYIASLKTIGQGGKVLAEPNIQLLWKNILSEAGRIDPILKTDLEPIVTQYEAYLSAEKELANFEGIIDENIENILIPLAGIFGMTNIPAIESWGLEQYAAMESNISTKIEKLGEIKDKLDPKIPAHKSMDDRISVLILNLEGTKKEVITKAGGQLESSKNLPINPTQIAKDFDQNPAKLYGECIPKFNELKAFAEKDYNSIDSVHVDLKDIKETLAYLTTLVTGLNGITASNSNQVLQQTQATLLTLPSEVTRLKGELENKLVKPFNEVNNSINSHKETLDGLKENGEINAENIKKLQEVANFLEKQNNSAYSLEIPYTSIILSTNIGPSLSDKDKLKIETIKTISELFVPAAGVSNSQITQLLSHKTLSDLQSKYNSTKESFEVNTEKYINDLTITKDNYKSTYDTLSSLERALGDKSTLLNSIKEKKTDCIQKYFENTPVQGSKIYAAFSEDLTDLLNKESQETALPKKAELARIISILQDAYKTSNNIDTFIKKIALQKSYLQKTFDAIEKTTI